MQKKLNLMIFAEEQLVAAAAAGASGGGTQLIVTDLSAEERTVMAEERKRMEQERQQVRVERAQMASERDTWTAERDRLQQEHVTLLTSSNANKHGVATWQTKHEALKKKLENGDDWRKRYEVKPSTTSLPVVQSMHNHFKSRYFQVLLAQFEAVCGVAVVNTDDERNSCEVTSSPMTQSHAYLIVM